MDSVSFGHMIYLIILGVAIVGWFIAQNRLSLGKTVQQAMVWGLIFVGVISAVALWQDVSDKVLMRQSELPNGSVEVPISYDGHYYLTLNINGTDIEFNVDTGASGVVLTPADARRIGIEPGGLDFLGEAMTANGVVRTAFVTLEDVRLGEIYDATLPAYVNEADMDTSLLGMDYLNRFQRIELTNGKLILTR